MSYAPRSPDLSGIAPRSPDLASAQYAPRSPDLSALHPAADQHVPPLQHAGSAYGQPGAYMPGSGSAGATYLNVPDAQLQQQLRLNAISNTNNPAAAPAAATTKPRARKASSTDDYANPSPFSKPTSASASSSSGPGRGRGRKKAKLEEQESQQEPLAPAPGEVEGVRVQTRFPVARIKRIMQHDEDVGKVSQVTPMAVNKALELFMIAIVLKSAEMAKSKESKKVTVAHMKEVVARSNEFDFLGPVCEKYADAQPGPAAAEKGKGRGAKGAGKKGGTDVEEGSDE